MGFDDGFCHQLLSLHLLLDSCPMHGKLSLASVVSRLGAFAGLRFRHLAVVAVMMRVRPTPSQKCVKESRAQEVAKDY